jgi:hypothetical protein
VLDGTAVTVSRTGRKYIKAMQFNGRVFKVSTISVPNPTKHKQYQQIFTKICKI